MLSIQLERFGVRFPNFVLHPIDLAIQPGERVAMVGANGAGKSTTLKAIAGRLRDYSGRVLVGGTEVRSQLPDIRAKIGFLPERALGFGWMTVADHLRFLSAFYPTWDRAYENEMLARLALPRDSKVGTLSKGMGVKLSFIAAEASRPPLLILDEPTSSIDPLMRGELLAAIDECAPRETGRIVLFSTHILEDVEKIADRVVFLRDGRLQDDLTVEELRGRDRGSALTQLLYSGLQKGSEDQG